MKEITVKDIKYYGVEARGHISIIFHWGYTIESEEDLTEEQIKQLPGEEVDPKKDYSPEYKITNEEMIEWLTDNVKPGYLINSDTFYFDNEEDAMAFKLAWT